MKANITRVFSVPGYTTPRDDPAVTADDDWILVMALKQTAGVVTLADRYDVPGGQGAGIDLPTDTPIYMLLAPGSRLYAVAENGSQRVAFTVMPLGGLLRMLAIWMTEAAQANARRPVVVPQAVVVGRGR